MSADDPAMSAFQQGLAAEHAAVFAYGVLGPRLSERDRQRATDSEAAHRETRDAAAALLSGRGSTPVPAERAYALPYPVPDAATARKLALLVEERVAATWRAAVAVTAGEARRIGVDALGAAAVRAASWRAVAKPGGPATVAFPGETVSG
jgi:hypothetical protein